MQTELNWYRTRSSTRSSCWWCWTFWF